MDTIETLNGREVLKRVMQEKGISQSDLARSVNMSRQLVHKWVSTDKYDFDDISAANLGYALQKCGYNLIAIPFDFEIGDKIYKIGNRKEYVRQRWGKRGKKAGNDVPQAK